MNNKRNKLHLHCLMLVMLVIVMTFFVSGFDMTRRVIVEVDGQTKVLRTNTSNPKKILAEAGIILENGDGWRLKGANKQVQDGSVIEVVRGIPFVVIRGEEAKEYKSAKETVGAALNDIGISHLKERVYPEVQEPLQAGMKIYVLAKNE